MASVPKGAIYAAGCCPYTKQPTGASPVTWADAMSPRNSGNPYMLFECMYGAVSVYVTVRWCAQMLRIRFVIHP